jgi:hypothetical protein
MPREDLDSGPPQISRRWSERSSTPPAIESLNDQLRKIIQNRDHFPSDVAMIKRLRIVRSALPPDVSAHHNRHAVAGH